MSHCEHCARHELRVRGVLRKLPHHAGAGGHYFCWMCGNTVAFSSARTAQEKHLLAIARTGHPGSSRCCHTVS